MFLNITISSLALVGSVGTIAFGTLWCQGRNAPVPPGLTPSEPTIVKLDQYEYEEGSQECVLSTTNLSIQKDEPIALVSRMEDIKEGIDKSTELNSFLIIIRDLNNPLDFPTFYGNCEFYIDDTWISPDHYHYTSSAMESHNFLIFN